jgi:hypothetical protein
MRNDHNNKIFFLFLISLLFLLPSCSSTSSVASHNANTLVHATQKPLNTSTPIPQCTEKNPATETNTQITVTVKQNCILGVSNYAAGLTYSDNSLLSYADGGNGNPAAVHNVDTLINGTITYENTHIMGWGASDPWPDPTTPDPTDWSSLDQRLQHTLSVGATPVITLDEAPWWMKGALQGDGTTKLLTVADEWANIAYGSRILDNKMSDWLHLVQRIAERYMAPPYNVRYFQVWNEMKGYYNPQTNNWDFNDSPGKPDGSNALHGYTYMYNQVYTTLMNVAKSLHISTDAVKVGGPYIFMDIWRTAAEQSNPSNVGEPYGTFDQRPLDVIEYWLQHKLGAGFITIDGSLEDHNGKMLNDPMVTASIFADTVKWIRSHDPSLFPGATTLPIWFAEWFASPPPTTFNENYDDAVKSLSMIDFIKAGGGTALAWGGSGDGTSDMGYWTPTDAYGGGRSLPWYNTVKILSKDFGNGTKLYPATVSNIQQVDALASDHHILVVNKTANTISLTVNGTAQTLAPYQVSEISY